MKCLMLIFAVALASGCASRSVAPSPDWEDVYFNWDWNRNYVYHLGR